MNTIGADRSKAIIQRDDMIEQGAQAEDENTTPSCAGGQLPSCEIFFDAAALPISLKRMAATPFARCPGPKSKLGRVKVSIASAVDYEIFPGQEYICTAEAMETCLCEKLIF